MGVVTDGQVKCIHLFATIRIQVLVCFDASCGIDTVMPSIGITIFHSFTDRHRVPNGQEHLRHRVATRMDRLQMLIHNGIVICHEIKAIRIKDFPSAEHQLQNSEIYCKTDAGASSVHAPEQTVIAAAGNHLFGYSLHKSLKNNSVIIMRIIDDRKIKTHQSILLSG